MKAAATTIAARFGLHTAGGTSAAKLAGAAPFPSASAGRPSGVGPTSNEPELMPGKVATAGRIRFRIAGMGGRAGARMFPDITTCVQTWRKRNPGVLGMLPKILSGT